MRRARGWGCSPLADPGVREANEPAVLGSSSGNLEGAGRSSRSSENETH